MKRLFLLIFPLLLLSCSREYDETIRLTPKDCENETAFCNYLADTLNAYIAERTEWAIDDRTSPFSKHYYKMLYEYAFESDSVRLESWCGLLDDNGLAKDSLESFINRHIEVYNTLHEGSKLDIAQLSPLEVSTFKNIKSNRNRLETCEVVDFADLLLIGSLSLFDFLIEFVGSVIGFIFIGLPCGLINGFFNANIDVENDIPDWVYSTIGYLCLVAVYLFFFYICIQYSNALQGDLIQIYSEYLVTQDILTLID